MAVVVLILLAWATFRYGIPIASSAIAAVIPPSVLSAVGEQTFAGIDRFGLRASTLPLERRTAVSNEFHHIVAASGLDDAACRIEFRAAEKTFGPNAFAFPPCFIVVTDELVTIAAHDDELKAVLAHELGHIKYRHGLRRIIQDTFLTFILLMITGDATQISGALAGLPVLLLEFGYARNFEREADVFARDYMRAHNIDLQRFPAILRRIEQGGREKSCDPP
jgi:Zn-dependent protease with chaperone function